MWFCLKSLMTEVREKMGNRKWKRGYRWKVTYILWNMSAAFKEVWKVWRFFVWEMVKSR